MSDKQPPSSFINHVLQMGYPFAAVQLAQRTTHSNEPEILLEWILSHENEFQINSTENVDETYLAKQAIQKVIELGFPRSSAETARTKTKSSDVEILVEWILNHDTEEQQRSILTTPNINTSRSTVTTRKQQEPQNKNDDTLINDLLKLGFDANDIRNCLIDLNINATKKFDSNRKQAQCINWLIDQSQKRAQFKATELDRSRKQLRIPLPIESNIYRNRDSATAPRTVSNNFLKQIHLSSRQQTTDDQKQRSELTPEEVRMVDIRDHLQKQSWTIHNLDQLDLIQKYIQIVSKIIHEDHNNIQRYSDNDDEKQSSYDQSLKPTRTTTVAAANVKSKANNDRSKKFFTLADLQEQDHRNEYKPIGQKQLETPPRAMFIPGAMEEANWDTSLLTDLDRVAVQFDYRPGENYRQLVDRLIEQCHISHDDQFGKVRAVFVWITSHIRYDITTSKRDNAKDKNDNDMDDLCHLILQTSTCVCVGYAVLFKRMCQHFNIHVDYVCGYTKLMKACRNDTEDANDIQKLAGHAWNMIHINGKTYFTDPTWSSATWSSANRLESPFTNTYYLVLPKYSIYQFRPHNNHDQHMDSPWSIPQFLQEPCLYPHFFRSKFTLEDREIEWAWYRQRVDRDRQQRMTKSFRITTRKNKLDSRYPLMITGSMYWSKDLKQLANEGLGQLYNTNYEHKLSGVKFQQIDLTHADNHLRDKTPLFIGELNDIPIYPPKLDVNNIQFGLLSVSTIDQSSGYYERIFQCIFEFQ